MIKDELPIRITLVRRSYLSAFSSVSVRAATGAMVGIAGENILEAVRMWRMTRPWRMKNETRRLSI